MSALSPSPSPSSSPSPVVHNINTNKSSSSNKLSLPLPKSSVTNSTPRAMLLNAKPPQLTSMTGGGGGGGGGDANLNSKSIILNTGKQANLTGIVVVESSPNVNVKQTYSKLPITTTTVRASMTQISTSKIPSSSSSPPPAAAFRNLLKPSRSQSLPPIKLSKSIINKNNNNGNERRESRDVNKSPKSLFITTIKSTTGSLLTTATSVKSKNSNNNNNNQNKNTRSCKCPPSSSSSAKTGSKKDEKKIIDIRPLRLTLAELRGGSMPIRSTYVLEKKSKEKKDSRRAWRSLSPEILRSHVTPLTSPTLVAMAKQRKARTIIMEKTDNDSNSSKSNTSLFHKRENYGKSLLKEEEPLLLLDDQKDSGTKDKDDHKGNQSNGKLSKHELEQQYLEHRSFKYLMMDTNSRNVSGTQTMGRLGHADFQGRRMDIKNIYSEPRSISTYTKPKMGYRLVDMYDDDPGICSEAETSSTGLFRRGGKARSSLPVVRTPSKTLERPLGLVFLQYRSETKRALLPNEITSMDTVRALFVRSFSKQLTMEYLDAVNTKIYIHDSAKDMFYELEDLSDIRDRSVLRLFEPNVNGNGSIPEWIDADQYFSEPECDTTWNIHKKPQMKAPIYSYSLPRPTARPFSPVTSGHVTQQHGGHTQSLLRQQQQHQQQAQPVMIQSTGSVGAPPKPIRHHYNKRPSTPNSPLYSPRSSGNTFLGIRTTGGVMDIYSTAADAYTTPPEKLYDNYNLALQQQQQQPRSGSLTPVLIDEESRIRMEHMERQLANLTGLVQKAILSPNNSVTSIPASTRLYNPRLNYRDYIPTRDFIRDDIDKQSSSSSASQDDPIVRPEVLIPTPPVQQHSIKAQKFGKEKSVSFSDDPPDQLQSSMHRVVGGQSEIKLPSKPAIKSTTLPRVNQQASLSTPGQQQHHHQQQQQQQQPKKQQPIITTVSKPDYFRTDLNPELYNQLRNLQKKAKELKIDVKVLRRHVQAQTHEVSDSLRETFLKFKVLATLEEDWLGLKEPRLRREEEMYKLEVNKLDKDILDLEQTVEELRSHVINKRMRVNMSDVENMALVLSKSSKAVADLKARFPSLQESVGRAVGLEMERLASEDRFLKTEPERLEGALRRCKKLTGTLVTLKRLASVQEQRLPVSLDTGLVGLSLQQAQQQELADSAKNSNRKQFQGDPDGATINQNNETLDELLDELKMSKSTSHRLHPPSPPRRLPSYPSTESGGSPVHPPTHPTIPPKPSKIPPPPPPRSSSKALSPPQMDKGGGGGGTSSMSESSESVNSQDVGLTNRHLELLKKQRQLQEQFSRLQQSVNVNNVNNGNNASLKKTGSESNIRGKLSFASTGSLGNLGSTANQLYETDIL